MLKSISAAALSVLFLCSCITVNAAAPPLVLTQDAYSKGGTRPRSAPNKANERFSKALTFKLGMDPTNPDSYCSATAIGPATLLTAKHCTAEISGKVITLDGRNYGLKEVISDDMDHAMIVFKEDVFDRWADLAKQPDVGDEVYMWGNSLFDSFLRRGYVSTYVWDRPFMDIQATGWMVLDIQVSGGDSGAGIFNRHGQLVAVLTGYQGSRTSVYAACMPFAFSRDAIRAHVPNPKHLSPQ